MEIKNGKNSYFYSQMAIFKLWDRWRKYNCITICISFIKRARGWLFVLEKALNLTIRKEVIDNKEDKPRTKPQLLDDLEKTSTLQILDDIEKGN